MTKNKHIYLAIFALFALVLVSGCAQKTPKPVVNNTTPIPVVNDTKPTPPPPPPKPIPENYVSISTADISGWITFRHEGMGIEISTPKEFYIVEQRAKSLRINNRPEEYRDNDMRYKDLLKMSIIKYDDKYTGQTYDEINFCEEDTDSTVIKCEEIEINEHFFTRDFSKDIMENNYFFSILGIDLTHPTNSNFTNDEVENLYIKILSTVKFIK